MKNLMRIASLPRVVLVLAAVLSLGALTAWAAQTVFVTTKYASLRAGKKSTDPVVEKLTLGQSLTVTAEDGAFWKVKTPSGKTGFVARAWTGASAPGSGGMGASLGAAARGSTSGGVGYTAGARGLSQEAVEFGEKLGAQDAVAAVRKLETRKASDTAVEKFLQDGKLGDWRDAKAGGQ